MTYGPRSVKVGEWTERLQRFDACELTVAEFCRYEGVSQPAFYRWRKRLARSATDAANRHMGGNQSPGGNRPPASISEAAREINRNARADSNRQQTPPSPFKAVRLTAAVQPPATEPPACLSVRLPNGVELSVSDHLPVVETVVGKLLEHAAAEHPMTEGEGPVC